MATSVIKKKGKACKIKTEMETQGIVKFEEVTCNNSIGNITTQQLTTINPTAQAGAEPGRIQEALAGFAKVASTYRKPRILFLLKLHPGGLLRLCNPKSLTRSVQ